MCAWVARTWPDPIVLITAPSPLAGRTLNLRVQMLARNVSLAIAACQIVVTLPLAEFCLTPLVHIWRSGFSAANSYATAIIGLLILILPILAVYGVARNKGVGYAAMGVFPIVAGIGLGVTAIPFVKYLFQFAPHLSHVFVLTVNFAVSILAVVLYWLSRTGGDQPL